MQINGFYICFVLMLQCTPYLQFRLRLAPSDSLGYTGDWRKLGSRSLQSGQ